MVSLLRITPFTKRWQPKINTPEHTEYPWQVVIEKPDVNIVDANGLIIVTISCPPHFKGLSLKAMKETLQYSNAQRIVDCVNMCNGYSVKKMRVLLAPKMPGSWYRLNRMRKCVELMIETINSLTTLLRSLARKHPEHFEDDAIEAIANASKVTTQVAERIDELYSESWSLRNVRKA